HRRRAAPVPLGRARRAARAARLPLLLARRGGGARPQRHGRRGTGARDRAVAAPARPRARLRTRADAGGGGAARAGRPARLGGPDGVRLRRLLRLRRRGGRPPAAALRRRPRPARPMSVPILNASGCLDALVAPGVARQLDAFVTKTITPPPRIAETEHGMLNSIGLQGPGLDRFLERDLPRLAELGVPLWVSAGGFSADDFALVCARLDERPEVETIELNLSCPNVEEAPETSAQLVAAARAATSKPLFAKLSPASRDVAEAARAVEA